MKTLSEWLSYIETLHVKAIDLKLDRVSKVANLLHLTSFECPIIIVGGTNGKGSCVKLLETILTLGGYQVGAYTSPHLLSFNERIRVANKNIDDETLCLAFEEIESKRKDIALTFFEFTTLAALWIFKNQPLDILILEVGLGGRLDAVNIVDSDVAIITSISIDHTDWLGTTRESIGFEKAGIFRRQKVAICGDLSPPDALLEYAQSLKTTLYCAGRDFSYELANDSWSWSSKESIFPKLPMPLLSIQNTSTVLMALMSLKKELPLSKDAITQGIKTANLQGRFQQFEQPYTCLLDVAHNPASSELLAKQIETKFHGSKFIAVVGMLVDKDIAGTLKPLLPFIKEWHLGTLDVPRGASSQQLASHFQDFDATKWYTHKSISDAFKVAVSLNTNEKILVFGSFYTVAEVLYLLQNAPSAIKDDKDGHVR